MFRRPVVITVVAVAALGATALALPLLAAADHSETALVSTGPDGGNGAFNAVFRGASQDGTKVFFHTFESLVSGDTDSSQDVYERSVVVSSNTPPDCSGVTAAPRRLKPASGQKPFQQVTLGGATDLDGDTLSFHIDGVSQDEPVTGAFAGDNTTPDAGLTSEGADSHKVLVRAEANPDGNGRVYRISYTVSDGTDDCSGVATVSVTPNKKGKPTAPVDDGNTTSYDSFTGATLP